MSDLSSDVCSADLKAPDKSVGQMDGEAALGALADAGLTLADVDGYFCAGDATGLGAVSMADYLNLRLRHRDSTEIGGSSYVAHVAHAANAIRAGKCDVALITLAGRSEEHTSELQSLMRISYAVFCLKKKSKEHKDS